MVFQLQTNSPNKLKKSWFFKNIFFLYEFLSKIQIGFDYHRTWWYQFFRYFLCKIFSPEISCDFDLSSLRSSLRSLVGNMKRYMVLVVTYPFGFSYIANVAPIWYTYPTTLGIDKMFNLSLAHPTYYSHISLWVFIYY